MKKNTYYFLAFVLVYILGFLAWHFSYLMLPFFIIFALGFAYLLFKDFSAAMLVLFTELILFSKGNLFHIGPLSLRMAFWALAIVYSLYFFKKIEWKKLTYIFLPLAFMVLWSFAWGYFNNGLSNALADANAYFYFLIILPLSLLLKDKKFKERFLDWFIAASVFLSVLTLAMLFIFSHGAGDINSTIYLFFRKNGLGEITYAGSGFWRIFMQSQIYLIPAFLLTVWKFLEKRTWKYFFLSSLFLSGIIVSFSRSFWLGLVLAVLALLIYKISFWKKFFLLALIPVAALLIVFVTAQLPLGNFGVISSRTNLFASEAALSSRWQLLPVMTQAIAFKPLLGYGFGKTLIYQTQDPRVLEYSPEGWYSTYAFEWGYLDILLKIGLLGLLTYAWALWQMSKNFSPLLVISLLAVLVLNTFSPYLNHPLGISYILVLYILANLPKSS